MLHFRGFMAPTLAIGLWSAAGCCVQCVCSNGPNKPYIEQNPLAADANCNAFCNTYNAGPGRVISAPGKCEGAAAQVLPTPTSDPLNGD